MQKLFLLLILLSLSTSGLTQNNEEQPKGSLKVGIAFPVIASNYSFRALYKGIFDVEGLYQYNVYKGLTVGGGVKFDMFKYRSLAFSDSVRFPIIMTTPMAKLSYEKILSDLVAIDIGARIGYSFISSTGINCTDKQKFGGLLIEPKFSFYLFVNGPYALSLNVSYAYLFQNYSPAWICDTTIPGYNPSDWEKDVQYFTVGFGFSWYHGIRESQLEEW